MFHTMLLLQLTSADGAAAIQTVIDNGITLFDAVTDDADITIRFRIRRTDYQRLMVLAQKKGYDIKLLHRSGLYWQIQKLLKRPVLVIGIAILCILAMYLPSRIFFVRVEGNASVPTRLILEKAGQCGIGFGSSRKAVRSQKMKDALLHEIPQLQWAGVNTSGCTAIITVLERDTEPEKENHCGVSSLVALCDGIITECTVTRGSAVCKVGQAVRAGDLLVSGFTDCGIHIQATKAEAEVYANTKRKLTAFFPADWFKTKEHQVSEKKYSLIIGKNRINFYKGSGISGTTCDKMYSESYITLPGGFVLPVAIVTEVWTYAESEPMQISEEAAKQLLDRFTEDYLSSQMVAGSILEKNSVLTTQDGAYCLEGNYACSEMIAQVRNEEIIKPNGKYN